MPLIEERAIRQFIEQDYPALVGALALVCGSRVVAEDVVQDALARAWERSGRGLEIDSLPAWVTTVALNLARSGLRRRKAERRATDRLGAEHRRVADSLAGIGASGDALDVERAVRALPRRQREAVTLRYYRGLDVREVAAALAVSEETV